MPANLLVAIWRSIVVTLRALWRVTRQLFHEATGALFAVFAAYGAFAAWRQWKYHPPQWQWIIGFAVVYAIMMAAVSFGAFRRARRVR
jgi:glycerol uptake facilitator-like aquaporin